MNMWFKIVLLVLTNNLQCTGSEPCDACQNSTLYRSLCTPANFKESRSVQHSKLLRSLMKSRNYL